MSQAKSLEQQPMIIPGEYDAFWGGYEVEIIFRNGNKSESFRMNQGIRGFSKCKARVDKDGWVYID